MTDATRKSESNGPAPGELHPPAAARRPGQRARIVRVRQQPLDSSCRDLISVPEPGPGVPGLRPSLPVPGHESCSCVRPGSCAGPGPRYSRGPRSRSAAGRADQVWHDPGPGDSPGPAVKVHGSGSVQVTARGPRLRLRRP